MRYRYYIVDVFTDTAFGGNQLAVLPEAQGLDTDTMQRIAREFNFSETTFVLPPKDSANTHQVRIFTPQAELPFAGHPNVGTAFALAAQGHVDTTGGDLTLRFEELAGLVPVKVTLNNGKPVSSELTAPQAPRLGQEFNAAPVAETLSLAEDDIISQQHKPRLSSTGNDILCIEIKDKEALARARIVLDKAEALLPRAQASGFYLYTHVNEPDIDIRTRMFAPMHGILEDPATGSAAAALAGLLALLDSHDNAHLQWRIAQGIEMGRPSLIHASADKANGDVTAIRVAGSSVVMAEGWLHLA